LLPVTVKCPASRKWIDAKHSPKRQRQPQIPVAVHCLLAIDWIDRQRVEGQARDLNGHPVCIELSQFVAQRTVDQIYT
jgi:predicted transcriptional regulator